MRSLEGDLKGKRVGYSADWGYAAVDPEVREIVGKAVKVFERDLGCQVEEVNPGWSDLLGSFFSLLCSETDLEGLRRMVQKQGDNMSTHVVDFVGRN